MKLPKISPKVTKSLKKTGFRLKKSSPTILTVIATVGVVATGVLSAKAAPKAIKLIEEGKKKEDMTDISKVEIIAIDIKYGWKPFIPAVATGISTIACIFGANILNKKQQAALTSAYMMLESQYKDYRKKVIERHGEEEDKEIISEIIRSSIEPLSDYDEVLTFTIPYVDEYFESTTANVAFAIQQLNYFMMADGYCTLAKFLEFLGLEDKVQKGDENIGWSGEYIMLWFGLKNTPLERQAQALANAELKVKKEAYPELKDDKKQLKKIGQQALTRARTKVGAHRNNIEITDREWEAIQAGAVSDNVLKQILDHTDIDQLRARATPRTQSVMSPSKVSRAKSMRASGYTNAEIAKALGVSASTVSKYL